MNTVNSGNGTRWAFSSSFGDALVKALSESSGSSWSIAAVPDANTLPDGSEPVRIGLTCEGELRGGMQLEILRAEAVLLVETLLRKQCEAFGTEESEALLALVKTGVNDFASTSASQFGTFTIDASSNPIAAPDLSNPVQITIADDNEHRVSIRMHLDPSLCEALDLLDPARTTSTFPEGQVKPAGGKSSPEPVNLSLVMDVELNVTLRFGQRQLTLREVMELTTGSVVELDRQVEAPVELLLEGKVIARGEAVVIDGNYGLRITEVSPTMSSAVMF